jgi:hypothetical protein
MEVRRWRFEVGGFRGLSNLKSQIIHLKDYAVAPWQLLPAPAVQAKQC